MVRTRCWPWNWMVAALAVLGSSVSVVAADTGESETQISGYGCEYDRGIRCTSRDGEQEIRLNFLAQFRFTGLFASGGQTAPASAAPVVDGNYFGFGEARGRFMAEGQIIPSLRYRFFAECATGNNCEADQMWGDWRIGSAGGVMFGQMKRFVTLQHSLSPLNLAFADEATFTQIAGAGLGLGIRPYAELGPVRLSLEIMNDSAFLGGANRINGDFDGFHYTLGLDVRLAGESFDWDQIDQRRGDLSVQFRGWFAWETIRGRDVPSVDFGGGRVVNLRDDLERDTANPISPTCHRYFVLSSLLRGRQVCTGVEFPEAFWNRYYGGGNSMVHSSTGAALLARLRGLSLLLESNYRRYEFAHTSQGFDDFAWLLEAGYLFPGGFNLAGRFEQAIFSDGPFQALVAGRDPVCAASSAAPLAACPHAVPGAPRNTTFTGFYSWGFALSYLLRGHDLKVTADYLHYELPWRAADPISPLPGGGYGYPRAVETSLMRLPSTGKSRIQRFGLSGDSSPEMIRIQVQVVL